MTSDAPGQKKLNAFFKVLAERTSLMSHVFAEMVQYQRPSPGALLQCYILTHVHVTHILTHGCMPHGDQLTLSMQQRHKFDCPSHGHHFVRQWPRESSFTHCGGRGWLQNRLRPARACARTPKIIPSFGVRDEFWSHHVPGLAVQGKDVKFFFFFL